MLGSGPRGSGFNSRRSDHSIFAILLVMKLYNTLTRSLEEFTPLVDFKVTFYQCGPTVYWTQHIGNMRAMVMADLIRRSLTYLGYSVQFARNYTDVGHLTSDADVGEDKMEKAAKRESLSPQEVAEKYIRIFDNDTKQLNVLEPDFKPRASQYVDRIITMIKTLLETKHAYITQLAVYFDVSTFPTYNQLNRQKMDLNIKGKGKGTVDDPDKKHFADFTLWFFKKGTHEHALRTWRSPWGEGFPGWHIECSVMTKDLFGPTIDIHMGGIEHISVHHTNEIAQSEAANGVKFVNYWLHNEHLTSAGGKMAKSEGSGLSLSEVTKKGYDPLALRYFFLTAHYRTRQDFSYKALASAQEALNNLRELVRALKHQSSRSVLSNEKLKKLDEYRLRFRTALENDIQIPQALSIMWELIKSNIPSGDKLDLVYEFDQVFGLRLNEVVDEKIPKKILEFAHERESARKKKDFKTSDELRKKISKLGYVVEDVPGGYRIKKSQ